MSNYFHAECVETVPQVLEAIKVRDGLDSFTRMVMRRDPVSSLVGIILMHRIIYFMIRHTKLSVSWCIICKATH